MARDKQFESVISITENRARIMAVILAMVRDFHVAEDLFQETIVEVMTHLDRYDPERDLLPWVAGIARNVVRRYWRDQARRPETASIDSLEFLASVTAKQDAEPWREEREALHHCLKKVPQRLYRLLLLRYGHNCKGDELARQASFRKTSLRTTLSRLRRRLRQCIRTEVVRAT